MGLKIMFQNPLTKPNHTTGVCKGTFEISMGWTEARFVTKCEIWRFSLFHTIWEKKTLVPENSRNVTRHQTESTITIKIFVDF